MRPKPLQKVVRRLFTLTESADEFLDAVSGGNRSRYLRELLARESGRPELAHVLPMGNPKTRRNCHK